ncbi:MAG: transglycosylase domain-containing protein, partial [Methylomicrobium sp.]|nr:transglycosylase domain-containing protein [Methylomicrobium sp.]
VILVKEEIETSRYQAQYLSEITKQLSFKLEPGSSSSIRFPSQGPYDRRLGYTSLPDMISRLENNGFKISAQANSSNVMLQLNDYGLNPIYQEKIQTGLRIIDYKDRELFNTQYPTYGYAHFDAIPPLILNTLLFIENRELLNDKFPTVNPAIEWGRLGFAGMQFIAKQFGSNINVPGGSTLATQLEKYRHSSDGYTHSIKDKLQQMVSASIRAYLLGPDTREMRKQIALSYLNSMPLAAAPKIGEIHGLGDGLSAWYGANFEETNRLLASSAFDPEQTVSPEQGKAYRQVLSLLLSQRRPSDLLGSKTGFKALQNLTDSYLRVMAEQGLISTSLRDASLQVSVASQTSEIAEPAKFMTEKKTQAVLRTRLARALGVHSIYELDRIDLTAKSTIDFDTQQAVGQALRRLSEIEGARAAGAIGFRLLNETNDPSPIIYSLMLFERSPKGNLLRVQTDNYDQPLDINEGIKIDLGSTAKLRTMVHYLELVTNVYELYKHTPVSEFNKIELHSRDYISAWVIHQLRANPTIQLEDLLIRALDRRFSASPGESFYTGGGIHRFSNFSRIDNEKILSVRDALRDSVNLVFIRLMREVVYHHLYKPGGVARWLEIPNDPRRQEYLQRFADREGRIYLRRFYAKYQDKSPEEALAMLTKRVYAKASRLSMLYQSIYPDASIDALEQFLKQNLSASTLSNEKIEKLHEKYSPANFDLQDQGYITKIHPLELWLVRYLAQHPNATREEILEASTEQRQEVYRWLFRSRRASAQQRRIMTLLEIEAFTSIHRAWQRTGYPFSYLTPSYASAIGASGDRPAALAELMGILQNDGIRQPLVRFEKLHFAKDTPYETIMSRQPAHGQRVFAPEIAKVTRNALISVVEGGTATRLRNVYKDSDIEPIAIGGKTGTGDHRRQVWGERGRLIESKFISRAATFAFFLGDRFFGVITAYVKGPDAENYRFTSSLPVQIVKSLEPTLSPLLNRETEMKDVRPTSEVTIAGVPQNKS